MYIRRKVFSTVEQPEEQLYSVTMTEKEYNLFSEFLEEREFTNPAEKAELKRIWEATGKPEGSFINWLKKNPDLKKNNAGEFLGFEKGKANAGAGAGSFKNLNQADQLRAQAAWLEEAEANKGKAVLNEGSKAGFKSKLTKAGMKARSGAKAAMKHVGQHKVGYGVGAAGLATAGVGAYALGKNSK